MNTPNYQVEEKVELQQRLEGMSCKEFEDFLFEQSIEGREGFFLLKSSKNLTSKEAITTYRNRDIIEKLMDSIKNTICIKPMRVWTANAIKGAVLIGFLAQIILAMFQYDNQDLHKYRHSTLLHSLRNLTLTIQYCQDMQHNRIISNIDNISKLIFDPKLLELKKIST